MQDRPEPETGGTATYLEAGPRGTIDRSRTYMQLSLNAGSALRTKSAAKRARPHPCSREKAETANTLVRTCTRPPVPGLRIDPLGPRRRITEHVRTLHVGPPNLDRNRSLPIHEDLRAGLMGRTLADMVGRLLVVGIGSITAPDTAGIDQLRDIGPRGVVLLRHNVVDAAQVRNLVSALKAALGTDLLIATDEEGGKASAFQRILGSTPPAREVARRDPRWIQAHSWCVGARLRDSGVDWNLAPVADLDDCVGSKALGDRSPSADPSLAAIAVVAAFSGLRRSGLITCAKHFPGLARANADTHTSNAVIPASLDDLMRSDLVPFVALIHARVPAVMVGHATSHGLDAARPASLSPSSYALLRSLGFRGVAITDSLNMRAVTCEYSPGGAAVRAIAAGADLVLATDCNCAMAIRDSVLGAVRAGVITQTRLRDALLRSRALSPRS
jgi:beta-N-acetylhexosaminidase